MSVISLNFASFILQFSIYNFFNFLYKLLLFLKISYIINDLFNTNFVGSNFSKSTKLFCLLIELYETKSNLQLLQVKFFILLNLISF